MIISKEAFLLVEHCLPRQRGNVTVSNYQILNAILHVTFFGTPWRELPSEYGGWHTVYMRINRWGKNGVLDRVFLALQRAGILRLSAQLAPSARYAIEETPAMDSAVGEEGGATIPADAATEALVWVPKLLKRSDP